MRAKTAPPLAIRLITHNIRYATKAPFKGEEPWSIRLPRLLSQLRFSTLHTPSALICLQEVLHEQLVDLLAGLNRENAGEWDYIGVGRDDGKTKGEYSPIIFRKSIWKCERWETVWLSETPDRPSKGWDAASIRILTVGHLTHRETGQKLLALCTHLDDQGGKARFEAAKMIADLVRRESKGGQLPAFLAGDFNSQTDEEAYKVLGAGDSPVRDLRDLIRKEDWYGHHNTYTGFGYEGESAKRIDFLFLGTKQTGDEGRSWRVKSYGVLENRFVGIYLSDHRAVIGDVELG